MPKQFNANHLSTNRTYEVQRTNHFEVMIPDLGEEFTLSVSRCSLPEMTINAIEVAHGNSKVKVAGGVDMGEGSLDVRDSILPDIEKKLQDWQHKAYNPKTGKMGWVDEYKRDCSVIQYAPDGTYLRTWKMEGCWITGFTPGDMDYENPDKKMISLTLAYDNCYRVD